MRCERGHEIQSSADYRGGIHIEATCERCQILYQWDEPPNSARAERGLD